jgi:hypothetical protein
MKTINTLDYLDSDVQGILYSSQLPFSYIPTPSELSEELHKELIEELDKELDVINDITKNLKKDISVYELTLEGQKLGLEECKDLINFWES